MARVDSRSRVRDLLFPPRCAACGELLPPLEGQVLCADCRPLWDEARLSVAEEAAETAVLGHAYAVGYRAGRADGVPERFIYHLKHRGDPRAFAFAAEALSLGVHGALRAGREAAGDGVVPDDRPPIYTYPPRRSAGVREDGFDQAKRLAQALSRAMGGELRRLLTRTHERETEQKTLSAEERRDNATHAYRLTRTASRHVAGRAVVLCDDLSTTGSTLLACTELLYAAGASLVVWATVGQTVEEAAETDEVYRSDASDDGE